MENLRSQRGWWGKHATHSHGQEVGIHTTVANHQHGPQWSLPPHPWVVFSHIVSGLVCMTSSIWQKRWSMTSRPNKKCHCRFCFVPWITHLGKASCHIMRTVKLPVEKKFHLVRNWGLLPKANTDWPAMWVRHLGSRSSSPSRAFRWDCSPSWHLSPTSWATLSSNCLNKLLSSSWPTKTARQ